MKALAFALASLLLLGLAAVRADIVIYKGTFKLKNFVDPNDGYPATVNRYLFVNYATREVHTLDYYTKNGKKVGGGIVTSLLLGDVTLAGVKPGRVLVDANASNPGGNAFIYAYTEYRGAKAPLTIRKTPATVIISEPRTFLLDETSVSSGQYYQAYEGLLTFQSKATLDVNASNLGIDSAREFIAQPLRARGYAIP